MAAILTNHAAGAWSNDAVAALSVVNRLFQLSFSLCLGIGQGMMPIAGYHYGAGMNRRVYQSYRLATLLATATLLAISLPLYVWAPSLISIFQSSAAVVTLGTAALRAQSAILFSHGIVTCANMLLQSLGKSVWATVLACARQGIFFLPLLFLLPRFYGSKALLFVQPLADAITLVFAIPFLLYIKRLLNRKTARRNHAPSRG